MKQIEIQYFFPLTEQIPLELDFSKSVEFECEKKAEMFVNSTVLSSDKIGGLVTSCSSSIEPASFTIDVERTPITVVSSKNPNFIKRWIYKTLGMKWKVKS